MIYSSMVVIYRYRMCETLFDLSDKWQHHVDTTRGSATKLVYRTREQTTYEYDVHMLLLIIAGQQQLLGQTAVRDLRYFQDPFVCLA